MIKREMYDFFLCVTSKRLSLNLYMYIQNRQQGYIYCTLHHEEVLRQERWKCLIACLGTYDRETNDKPTNRRK